MKKWMVLLCALLLCAPALAERELSCQVVGHQQLGGNDSGYDAYIVRVDVTDPQREIPPVYLLTEWVTEAGAQCELADVNFDGHEDLVAVVTLGASNALQTFYLWNEEAGAFRWYEGPSLWNYALDPVHRAVYSQGTSGLAGLLHENSVYLWDAAGTALTLWRGSLWEEYMEEAFESQEDGSYVWSQRFDGSRLVESYFDAKTGESTQAIYPMQRYLEEESFLTERLAYEQAFLCPQAETN